MEHEPTPEQMANLLRLKLLRDKMKELATHTESLRDALRKFETSKVIKPDTLYEVYVCTSQGQPIKLLHQGLDRDIAESKFVKLEQENPGVKFKLWDHTNNLTLAETQV